MCPNFFTVSASALSQMFPVTFEINDYCLVQVHGLLINPNKSKVLVFSNNKHNNLQDLRRQLKIRLNIEHVVKRLRVYIDSVNVHISKTTDA